MTSKKGSYNKEIVILSGPSCAGKTPLLDAVEKYHPDIQFFRPVLFTSRGSRPHEKEGEHYFFRTADEIQNLPADQFAVAKTRQNWQALDMKVLLKSCNLIIIDTHPKLAQAIEEHSILQSDGFHVTKVFLQPCLLSEIEQVAANLQCSKQQAFAAMRTPHLITREIKQGKELLPPVLSDIQVRVNAAWQEVMIGQQYDHIIINEDGEDSDHWLDEPPSGKAGEAMIKFIQILRTIDIKRFPEE